MDRRKMLKMTGTALLGTALLGPTAFAAEAKPEEKKEKQGKLVVLNSKSDAKRAFLYSEIFNRKY